MLAVLFLISSFLMSGQPTWTWSVHPESGFKILSPFTLVLKKVEIPTFEDPIVYFQYQGGSIQDSTLHLSMVIDHYKLTDEQIGGDEEHLHDFFGVTIDQILSSVRGKLDYMDITSHSDREVCIWRASFLEGEGILRGQLIISGDKYYGLQVFGLAKEKPDEMMHKFLDSFQMISSQKQ